MTQSLSTTTDSNQRIYDFLSQQFIGTLATADKEGRPHAAVVYYGIDKNFVITFITKANTRKHHNLLDNHRVAFLVYDSFTQTTARISGSATQIKDEDKTQAAYNAVIAVAGRTSQAGVPPISKLFAGEYITYEVIPAEINMAVYVRPESGGEELFEHADLTRVDA